MVDKQPLIEINTELIINNNYHAIHMARQLLQQCTQCKAWTFLRDCPHCDGTANAAAPMKWSPEDQRANIRRKMYNVESEEWLNDLPELENISDTRKNMLEEE